MLDKSSLLAAMLEIFVVDRRVFSVVDGVSVELIPQLCCVLILVELMYLCWVRSCCCCQEMLMFSVFGNFIRNFR